MSAPIITVPTARLEQAAAPVVALPNPRPGADSAQPRLRPGADSAQPRLRLTRRGRAVFGALGVLVVGVLLGVAAMFGASGAVASEAAGDAQFGYVVVQPGESLWGVASELDPSSDPRDLIAEIVRLNQLGGSEVQAGQPVAVPLRYAEAPGVVSAEELGL
jgi:hypothetical protein